MLRRLGFLLFWIGALFGGAFILMGIFLGRDDMIAWPAVIIGGLIVFAGVAFRYLFAGE